jgi:hypothetical protein
MSGRAAAAALLALLALSCRSLPAAAPGTAATGTGPLQVVHRAARSASGALTPAAAAALADAAALSAFPDAMPLDAWAAVVPGAGPVAVIAAPSESGVSRAIVDRLRAATTGRTITVLDAAAKLGADALREAAVVVVVTPAWTDGAVVPDPAAIAGEVVRLGGRRPCLVVADLTTVQVGAERWAADMIVAGTDPARVGVVTEFVLAARAARAIPDAASIARRRGLPGTAATWELAVIAN